VSTLPDRSAAERAQTVSPRPVDYVRDLTPEEIEHGAHRRRVGSRWDEMGRLQRDFLRDQGLEPGHRLLDVGCGALRGGVALVEYLEDGCYYGVDVNASLIEAGYDRELPPHLRDRLPRENLRVTERFECDFGVPFDYAIAHSLFTHVSLNHVRLCLYQVAKVMPVGGRFFATFFEAPEGFPLDGVRPGRRGKWTERNPFFYYRGDLRWAAGFGPWEFRYVGRWGHPRGQRMVEFRRVEQGEQPRTPTRPSQPSRTRGARLPRRVPGARALRRVVSR
jgi:SAM-dependent methyltransferase